MTSLIIKPESKGIYRLTTAEILYFMPDHREILQTYVWQENDYDPMFPNLTKFLEFWDRELEGPLHSVAVSTAEGLVKRDFQISHFSGRIH